LGYGVASTIAALIFFVFIRERPSTPPGPTGLEERSLVLDGLKQILHQKDFIFLMVVFFVGLGTFNAVTTWIEEIVRPRGFSIIQAGDAGGLMIAGGILGALVIPVLSDHYHRKSPFLVLAVVGATLGLYGITFARNYTFLLISAIILGFFLLSAGPVGFQYGADGTNLRDTVYPGHGQLQVPSKRLDDFSLGRADRINDTELATLLKTKGSKRGGNAKDLTVEWLGGYLA
jgi:Na+/melibiose symporter-like transporter